MQIEHFESIQSWELCFSSQKLSTATLLLVFKHSPICPTSHRAKAEFLNFVAKLSDVNATQLQLIEVDVISQRPISQRIAADTGVRHESPQALLLGNAGVVLWKASHDAITVRSLTDALAAVKS